MLFTLTDYVGPSGKTLLITASRRGNSYLKYHNDKVITTPQNIHTSIYVLGLIKVAETIIEESDINYADKLGKTALHHAAENGTFLKEIW